jgi:uncharacterized protein (TIGR03083 family)
MTMTDVSAGRPRTSALDRAVAGRLARTEYARVVDMLHSLAPADWTASTRCPGWDVRAMACHLLGVVDLAASVREQLRQNRIATARAQRTGATVLDALTALQVEERADLRPTEIVHRLAERGPKAARARRRVPGLVRRRTMPRPQDVGHQQEKWTFGYLIDVIMTRDAWMHRIDIADATGAHLELTPGHDGVLVADVVAEWATRHGRPFRLRLAGPAGGEWSSGVDGPEIDMAADVFCATISGRGPAEGLLTTHVPF